MDVQNSQLTLLTPKINKEHRKHYETTIKSSRGIYGSLSATSGLSRKAIKSAALKWLGGSVSGFSDTPSRSAANSFKLYKQAFNMEFGELGQMVSDDRKSKKLILELQTQEASIIISIVSKRPTERFSVHDAVMCLKEDVESVREALRHGYSKLVGITPNISIK